MQGLLRKVAWCALVLGAAATLVMLGCSQKAVDADPPSEGADAGANSAAEARTVAASDVEHLEDGVYLVDVRTGEEYAAGHIPGALNASYPKSAGGACAAADNAKAFRNNWASLSVPKSAHVVLYCRTGVRAASAASALLADGYTTIDVYEGSWEDWTSDPSRSIEEGNGNE